MIPLQLRISGFLSYRDQIEVDFTAFDLACISGQNGAGKSSLLDAITWALFGQARGKTEEVINLHPDVKSAEVSLTFLYEGNIYRAIRSLPRGKSTILEFQILDGGSKETGQVSPARFDQGSWRPLTEHTKTETERRIADTLRLDYETFVNASFFLQGKADQFTQQNAAQRKQILGSILGLEMWETYRARTAERRKSIEREIENLDGRLTEIENELTEEDSRKSRLAELRAQQERLTETRKAQETALEAIKQAAAALENQRKLTGALSAALERSQTHLTGLEARLSNKRTEQQVFQNLLSRAGEVESVFQAWQQARADLTVLDEVAAKFREQDARRQPLMREIEAERARLEQEQTNLRNQSAAINDQAQAVNDYEEMLAAAQKALEQAEEKLDERAALEGSLQTAREKQSGLKAENEALKTQMDALKERIDRLSETQGAVCPLCGQGLSEEHRKSTLASLEHEGKTQGDRYRANVSEMKTIQEQITGYERKLTSHGSAEIERREAATTITQLTERLESLKKQAEEWEGKGAKHLEEIKVILERGAFAHEARVTLEGLNKELETLGYDVTAHEKTRQAEIAGRKAEDEYRELEKAKSALKPIEEEIANLESEIENRKAEIKAQQREFDQAAAGMAASEAAAPDLHNAERSLFDMRAQENQLTQEVGAAAQLVNVLEDLRQRKAGYAAKREELLHQSGRHKTLERAFGKDGVPALLIEQALPQIEARANELLDHLSDGAMSIRFVTQAEYKDKKRNDLKETLDIQISDGAGVRAYEMFSGGEAFRVNFAIRLALSEVLSQRKGARLQTLVIDEGFGSQDAQGRQRLIEAINLVKGDFAKILVITHLDELKDAFPNRIEVEKTERGSTVTVL